MKLTPEQVLQDLSLLPDNYKTADVDRLIARYIREKADVSDLRPVILEKQQLHRIYYYVSLKPMKTAQERMAFIHRNLFFSDWWHTDQLIGFVADLDFEEALELAKGYICSEDAFVRRWGYVLFISKLGRGHASELLPLCKNDEHYTNQMAQGWLIAELAVLEPELVHAWMANNGLDYRLNGKAIQKICDSFRISKEWKEKFRALRPGLRGERL